MTVDKDILQTGDIVFMKNGRGFAPKFIERFTNSPYYHVGIIVRMKPACCPTSIPMLLESAAGGVRIVNVGAYDHVDLEVFENPIKGKGSSKWVVDAMHKAGSVGYGYHDLWRIWMTETFGIPFKDKKGEVCSEFVANSLLDAGVNIVTKRPSPSLLHAELIANNVELKGVFDRKK